MTGHFYAVIMAGGGGTRLWPLSRQSRPKQALCLDGRESLFQLAVRRLQSLFPPERILVVTVAEQARVLSEQAPGIPFENYLLEPLPRGTASVVGLAAMALNQRDPQATMAIVTADHFIQNEALFHKLLTSAYCAAQEHYLVTLGITPTAPSTGYGYIQSGESLGLFEGFEAHAVLKFKEKPDAASAQAMLDSGNHAWNSGMFIWRVEDILAEFASQMPGLHAQLQTLAADWGTPRWLITLAQTWPQVQAQTIDYGIMEHARRVAVIPAAELGWNDVGSWDSLFEVLEADAKGNIIRHPKTMLLDSHNTLVFSEESERLVVAIGAQDLIIIDTGDALLVCPRDQAQKVRQAVAELKKSRPEYS